MCNSRLDTELHRDRERGGLANLDRFVFLGFWVGGEGESAAPKASGDAARRKAIAQLEFRITHLVNVLSAKVEGSISHVQKKLVRSAHLDGWSFGMDASE